jgi:hypothetical protein
VQAEKTLEASNLSIVAIGPDQKYMSFEDEATQPYLDAIALEGDMPVGAPAAEGEADAEGDTTMA